MREKTKIIEGRWAYWQCDQPIPETLSVYEGAWENHRKVGTITKYQALAYYRHWNNGGIYNSVEDGNGNWHDIRVVGDWTAFMGSDR